MKGYLRIPYLLLTAIGIAMLGWALIWLNQRQVDAGAWRQASVAARLIDEEALAFIHTPDLVAALQAFETSHFSNLNLERPASLVLKRLLPEIFTLPSKEQLAEMAVQNLSLSLVPGKQGFEMIVALQTETDEEKLRAWVQTSWGTPGEETFSELRGGTRYHYITTKKGAFISAKAKDWQFIATERSLIERALTRLQSETDIGTLSTDTYFEQALKPLRSSYEVLAYVRPSGTITATEANSTDKVSLPQRLNQLPVTAVAAAFSNERGLLHEEISLLPKDPQHARPPQPNGPSHAAMLALTSTETLIYASANQGGQAIQRYLFQEFHRRWLIGDVPILRQVSEAWEESFNGSYAVILEPLRDPASRTSKANGSMAVILTFPLTDEVTMRQHLETLSETSDSGFQRSAAETYSLSSALLPTALANSLQEIHLSVHSGWLIISDHALGLSQVTQALGFDEVATLTERDDFERLSNRLPDPEAAMLFIDTESVLRRGVEAVQHPLVKATLWLGMRGSSSTNLLELFPWKTFNSGSDLIQPTLAVWEYGKTNGLHQESLGTLTPGQWLLGADSILSALDDTLLDAQPTPLSP